MLNKAVLLGAVFLLAASAQDNVIKFVHDKDVNEDSPMFFKGSYFKRAFERPETRVELQPPARLAEFVVDGKLELSMRSYLDLVLANNTEIAINRLSVEIPRNSIQRNYSIFDPQFFGSFTTTRQATPANDALAGALSLSTLNQPAVFRYTHTLETGTQYNVQFNTFKNSTNSAFQLFNPSISSNFNVNFSQPLVRNRGKYWQKLPVTIARSRLRGAEYNFEDQLLRQIAAAENAYWDVILARENVRVQEQALILADTSLKRAQRELELGAISALDIYQPQAQFANFQILLTQARFRLQQTEDILRRFIGADLDLNLRKLPIVLTESITPPVETPLDKEALVEKAVTLRPDIKVIAQNLDVDDLQLRSAQNSLRPDFRLTGQYGATGRGGPFTQRQNIFGADGTASTVINVIPGGFGDSLDQLFGLGYPVYGFGVQLFLPIRNRAASADYADAVVSKRLDTLRLRNLQQQVRQDVLNAVSQVENSRASVELAKVALDFAQKRVDAEQKKYDLGTITLFFLLDAQNALTQAQSALVRESVNYRRNLVNLLRFTGELLPERGITVQ
jgi:outer membrane protein